MYVSEQSNILLLLCNRGRLNNIKLKIRALSKFDDDVSSQLIEIQCHRMILSESFQTYRNQKKISEVLDETH